MDARAEIVEKPDDRSELAGLKLSAGLLFALGWLWGFYAIFSAVLIGVTGVRAWKGHVYEPNNARWFAGLAVSLGIMAALTWLCVKGSKALHNARRWGAYVAMVFGFLLLVFTGVFIYDVYHPEKQSPDEYFLVLVVPFTTAVGFWWCIYLNLPHVRARLSINHIEGVMYGFFRPPNHAP